RGKLPHPTPRFARTTLPTARSQVYAGSVNLPAMPGEAKKSKASPGVLCLLGCLLRTGLCGAVVCCGPACATLSLAADVLVRPCCCDGAGAPEVQLRIPSLARSKGARNAGLSAS